MGRQKPGGPAVEERQKKAAIYIRVSTHWQVDKDSLAVQRRELSVYSEMVLGSQPYLLDDTKTVGQVLKEKGINVLRFVRYQVGEGIEKRKDDFASEVMSQVK